MGCGLWDKVDGETVPSQQRNYHTNTINKTTTASSSLEKFTRGCWTRVATWAKWLESKHQIVEESRQVFCLLRPAMVCGELLTTQPGTLCNMHLSGTRSEGGQLPWGQQYPAAKDCDLVLLSCTSGTANWVRAVNATCAWTWQFSLGDICCTNKMHQHSWCEAAMLEREGRTDSLALGSEIKTRNHPIERATDIFPCSGCFTGLSKSAIYTIREFSLPQAFSDLLGLSLAWLHQPPRGWTSRMLVGNRHECIRWGSGHATDILGMVELQRCSAGWKTAQV